VDRGQRESAVRRNLFLYDIRVNNPGAGSVQRPAVAAVLAISS